MFVNDALELFPMNETKGKRINKVISCHEFLNYCESLPSMRGRRA